MKNQIFWVTESFGGMRSSGWEHATDKTSLGVTTEEDATTCVCPDYIVEGLLPGDAEVACVLWAKSLLKNQGEFELSWVEVDSEEILAGALWSCRDLDLFLGPSRFSSSYADMYIQQRKEAERAAAGLRVLARLVLQKDEERGRTLMLDALFWLREGNARHVRTIKERMFDLLRK